MTLEIYSITISPPYRLFRPGELYEQDSYVLRRWLNKFSKHYCLYPEFDKHSRLHYHGIVKIDDLTKYHRTKYIIDKGLGFVRIDKLKTSIDHLRFLIYSMKEWAQNKETFKTPIIYKRLKRCRYEPSKELDVPNDIRQYLTL